ncbi:MAG: tetratricopeptide repeat protein [Planctomycetota bacterium]|nr:tetratricopeptide repeat protein [Planctomycetota bacterium]
MFFRHVTVSLALCGLAASGGCQNARDWMTPDDTSRRSSVHRSAQTPAEVVKVNSRQTADVRLSLGRLLEQQGKFDQAEKAYRAALAEKPNSHVPYWRLGIVAGRRGKLDESLEWFNKALERSPGNPNIFCDVGYTLYLHGDASQAEMNYRQAIALQPTNERAQNNLGMLLARTGRVDESIAAFQKAKLDNGSIEENLGLALTMNGDLPAARDCYQRAAVLNPNSITAKRGLRSVDTLIAASGLRAEGVAPVAYRPTVPTARRPSSAPVVPSVASTPAVITAPAIPPAPTTPQPRFAEPHAAEQRPEDLHRPRQTILATHPTPSPQPRRILPPPSVESPTAALPPLTFPTPSAPNSMIAESTRPHVQFPEPTRHQQSQTLTPPMRIQPPFRSATPVPVIVPSSTASTKLPVIQPADLAIRRARDFDRPKGITNVDPWSE